MAEIRFPEETPLRSCVECLEQHGQTSFKFIFHQIPYATPICLLSSWSTFRNGQFEQGGGVAANVREEEEDRVKGRLTHLAT